MTNLERTVHHFTLGILTLFCSASGSTSYAGEVVRAQGAMAGEVTANSAIV